MINYRLNLQAIQRIKIISLVLLCIFGLKLNLVEGHDRTWHLLYEGPAKATHKRRERVSINFMEKK